MLMLRTHAQRVKFTGFQPLVELAIAIFCTHACLSGFVLVLVLLLLLVLLVGYITDVSIPVVGLSLLLLSHMLLNGQPGLLEVHWRLHLMKSGDWGRARRLWMAGRSRGLLRLMHMTWRLLGL